MQLCMPMTLPMAVAAAMMTWRMMLHVDFLFRFSIRDKVLMGDTIKKSLPLRKPPPPSKRERLCEWFKLPALLWS